MNGTNPFNSLIVRCLLFFFSFSMFPFAFFHFMYVRCQFSRECLLCTSCELCDRSRNDRICSLINLLMFASLFTLRCESVKTHIAPIVLNIQIAIELSHSHFRWLKVAIHLCQSVHTLNDISQPIVMLWAQPCETKTVKTSAISVQLIKFSDHRNRVRDRRIKRFEKLISTPFRII